MLGSRARALTPAGELASHRAVYELTLAQSAHGSNSSTVSARGRILYDFTGSACEGYKLEFRQVSELDNGEGKVTLSDLRSSTWEDGDAKNFHFKSENYMNSRLVDQVDGQAVRAGRQYRGHAHQADGRQAQPRPLDRVPDRACAPDHRRGARRQDHPGIPGL